MNKAGIAVLATQIPRIVRVYRSDVDDLAIGVVIAHFKRRGLVDCRVCNLSERFVAIEEISLVPCHKSVAIFALLIVARPADKVVLGAVSALNLLGGLDLKRNLVAGISAAEATDKIGIRKFRVDVRLNGNQAGTVDRVQLHGGLDHGRSTHHTDALRPSDIALVRCRLGFRPAHEDVELTRIPIDSADVISRLRDAAIKVAEHFALLSNFAVHIRGIEVVHNRQRRIVRHECIGSARFHRIRASTMLHIVGKRLDLAVRKLDLNLLQLIQLTACFINHRCNVRGHRCRSGIGVRVDNGSDVVARHIDLVRALKTCAIQVGGVPNIVLRVHRIGILVLGDLEIWFHQIRFGLIRVGRSEGVAIHVINIIPDRRVLPNLSRRDPAQELMTRHRHLGIGRRGFERQIGIDVTILSVVGLCINRPILIEMRIAIQERRITFRRFLLKQVAFIASSSSLLDVATLVIEVDVRGHHSTDIILLRRFNKTRKRILDISPGTVVGSFERPKTEVVSIMRGGKLNFNT